jgi:hypothetical protein
MSKITWSEGHYKKLRELYPATDTRKLARLLGKTYEAVKAKATKLGLKKILHSGSPWTKDKIDQLIKLYPENTNADIAIILKVSESAVAGQAFKQKLTKTKEFMLSCAMKTAYKPGSTPLNKGKKQSEFMSPEAIARTVATRFKKGEIAPNRLHYKDGDITIREHEGKNGKTLKYKWVRISRAEWKMLHVVNWEKVHGPILPGYIVVFKNKDTMNCEVDNLEMITLQQNMARNTIARFPVELIQTIRIINKIKKKIKTTKDEQQKF